MPVLSIMRSIQCVEVCRSTDAELKYKRCQCKKCTTQASRRSLLIKLECARGREVVGQVALWAVRGRLHIGTKPTLPTSGCTHFTICR